jgi:hypothetical protein
MTTYLLGVVGVFRKCRTCGEYFRLSPNQHHRLCRSCRRTSALGTIPPGGVSRGIVLTPKGKADLHAALAEDRKHGAA